MMAKNIKSGVRLANPWISRTDVCTLFQCSAACLEVKCASFSFRSDPCVCELSYVCDVASSAYQEVAAPGFNLYTACWVWNIELKMLQLDWWHAVFFPLEQLWLWNRRTHGMGCPLVCLHLKEKHSNGYCDNFCSKIWIELPTRNDQQGTATSGQYWVLEANPWFVVAISPVGIYFGLNQIHMIEDLSQCIWCCYQITS